MRASPYLIGCSLVAALGGLLFGFDTAVISGMDDALKAVFSLDGSWLGFTKASALIGTIIGSIVAGKPSDLFGRRAVLMVIGLLYLASAIGCALARDWYTFVFFRFAGGLGVGGASVVSPLYIAEIAPARLRGRLVAITQFNIVLGIVLAFLSNYLIRQLQLGENEWRWMFGVQAVPSIAFVLLLFGVPASPRWLMGRGRTDEARQVLGKLGNEPDAVESELAAIKTSLDVAHHREHESLFRARYRVPILLAVAIAMFNQLSGINAVIYYAPMIFKLAGAGKDAALLQTVAVGGTNLVVTMLAMTVIDRFGRRALMLVGSLGYIVSLGAIAWAFYTYNVPFKAAQDAITANLPVAADVQAAVGAGGAVVMVSLLVFIAAHAFGQGAVIWVFISEIFPNRVRASGQALGSFTHWIMAAIITQTFPMIAARSGAHAFAFYCAMTVLQLLWVIWIMPETKGVPLEDIQKKLGIE